MKVNPLPLRWTETTHELIISHITTVETTARQITIIELIGGSKRKT
jgi:hypothetical protein